MDETHSAINELLDKIRPYIEMHGGDVRLNRVEDHVAYLKVYGACVNCGLASVTYTKTVAPLIVKEIADVHSVVFE